MPREDWKSRSNNPQAGSLRDLSDFKYNLRLLGLVSPEPTKALHSSIMKHTTTSKLVTRLRKTLSLSDLNQEEILENRKLFNELVYQQWYVRAQHRQATLQKLQQLRLHEIRCEEEQSKKAARTSSSKALLEWKRRHEERLKQELERKRVLAAQQSAQRDEKLREKEERNKAGNAWRLAKKEEFLSKLRENRVKAQTQREEELRAREERQAAAQAAFRAWKRTCQTRNNKVTSPSSSADESETRRRKLEARQAYEEWKRDHDAQLAKQQMSHRTLEFRLQAARLQQQQERWLKAQESYARWLHSKTALARVNSAAPSPTKSIPWYANCKSNCYMYWEYL